MDTNKLKEGVFCQLKMGRWDARTQISPDKIGKKIPEIIRLRQDTIEDRTLLKNLTKIRRSAKGILKRNSIPFPIDGLFWIPKKRIGYLDESFTAIKNEYQSNVIKLCNNIKNIELEFKAKYPSFYDPKNYPSQKELKQKFYFYWNFLAFAIPDKKVKVLSPELYQKEKEKFNQMVVKMEEIAVNAIGNSLLLRIEKLSNQCESGKINRGTIKSIDKIIKKWEDLWEGHIDQAKLKDIIKTLEKQMKRVSTERLKNNEDFRTKLGKKLNQMSDKIKVIPDFKLRRRLDI